MAPDSIVFDFNGTLSDDEPVLCEIFVELFAEHFREAVRYAAERVPVAICSGAARDEIEPVIEAAGLAECFRAIVSSDDVVRGKPHPEGYRAALAALGTTAALVFEDTEAGVA